MKRILILILTVCSLTSFGQKFLENAPPQSPTVERINQAMAGAFTASGTDTYTVTFANGSYSYTALTNLGISVTFPNPNTGASTINFDGLGAKNVLKWSSGSLVAVSANDLIGTVKVRYDGTQFVMEGGTGSGGGTSLTAGNAIEIVGDSINVNGSQSEDISITNSTGKSFGVAANDGAGNSSNIYASPIESDVIEIKKQSPTNQTYLSFYHNGGGFTSNSYAGNKGLNAIMLSTGTENLATIHSESTALDSVADIEVRPHSIFSKVGDTGTSILMEEDSLYIKPGGVIGTGGQVFTSTPDGAAIWATPSGGGGLTEADLTASRTLTTTGDTDQTDNLNIIYADSGTPFDISVDALSVGTQITIINQGAATATLILGTGVTSLSSLGALTTVPIASGESALIIYKVAATPDVYLSTASGAGTVTDVSSANGDITVATGTTTPVLTLVQAPALRSATTTVNVSSATAPTSGQVLTATSGTAATWQNPSSGFSDPMTTRGDIIVRNASNVTARLGIGAANRLLQSDGTDISWAAPTFWSTANGGTASASNTRTFNTNNWDNTTYTYTTTGNGQFASNITGTITHRATVSDATYGQTTSRTFVTSANTQRSVDVRLNPVFTNGAHISPENFSLWAETGSVVVGSPTGAAIPVTQKMKIFGGSTSSSDIGFEVVDSGNVPLLRVSNGGTVNVKSNGIIEWQNANARIRSEATGSLSFALDTNHPTSGGFRFRAHAASQTSTADYPITTIEGTFSPTSGAARWIGNKQIFTINQTGTSSGDIVGYLYDPTIAALLGKNIAFLSRSGQHLMNGTTVTASTTLDVRGVSSGTITRFADNSDVEKFKFLNTGSLVLESTNTAGGTTGDRTINKISGTVNIAAAGTTVTVTNSLVTTSSIVFCVVRTNDTTALIKNVVPGAGSFVINMNAAVTAETSIGFFVIN